MYDLYEGDYADEKSKAAYLTLLFSQHRIRRAPYEQQWEEAAALCWPEYRNSFSFGHVRTPGIKYTQYQVDTAGSIASHQFMSICDEMLTPAHSLWSILRPSDMKLMRDRSTALWFETATRALWTERYKAAANFVGASQQNYQGLGVFGNMSLFTDELDSGPNRPRGGLRYIPLSVGEAYYLTNYQGRVDGFIRHFRWSARQAYQRWGDAIPQILRAALDVQSQELFDFLHFVLPRNDYDPNRYFEPQGKPYWSCYFCHTAQKVLEEGGYRTFPLAAGRYVMAPEEDYGRGPAQMVLPELKTLNSQKSDYLSSGHQQARPAYVIGDDGLTDFKTHSGAFNYGGFTQDGKLLISTMPTGNFEVSEKMMDYSARAIADAFLLSLFPILSKDEIGEVGGRQVIELVAERMVFMSPLARQYSDYLGPMIDRELDLLSHQGKLPPVTPAMREARADYRIEYASPLARAPQTQAIAGYWRTLEMTQGLVAQGADPALLDIFDLDVSLPEIAQSQYAPARWMAAREKIAAKARARQQQQQQENYIKSLPGLAARDKAQAIVAKAQTGGNIGGVLSGTPAGGMPAVQGNPRGQPGMRGIGGAPGRPGLPAR